MSEPQDGSGEVPDESHWEPTCCRSSISQSPFLLFSLSFSALFSLCLPLLLSPCRLCGLGVRQKKKRRPSSEIGQMPNLDWGRVSLRVTGNGRESDLTAGSLLGEKKLHGWRFVCWEDL